MIRLRKYLHLAGLSVKRNEFNLLKTKKARYEYIKKVFFDAGFSKDKTLSIKSCKKFKEKRDKAKEVAELDVNNIIDVGPRRTRGAVAAAATSSSKTQVKAR